MKMSALVCLTLFGTTLFLGKPAPSPDELVRQGNVAFDSGAYLEATALYESAGERITDPGLPTYNGGVARWQLVRQGEAPAGTLHAAEQDFRCCLGRANPRRPRAIYGLGQCLLLRGSEGAGDRPALEEAIQSFTQCLREAHDADLTEAAHQSLQRARLLLAQTGGAPSGSDDPPGEREKEPPSERPGTRPMVTKADQGKPDEQGAATPMPQPGAEPRATSSDLAPGAGTLPPVPDDATRPRVAAHDAALLLEDATRRIVEEQRTHRQSKRRTQGTARKDW